MFWPQLFEGWKTLSTGLKLYPVVKAIYLAITYLPDSDLSIG